MKPKANTLQERFGFKDDELTTPKHDEIMFWLNDNISTIIADLFPKEWAESELAAEQKLLEKAHRSWLERADRDQALGTEGAKAARLLEAEIRHFKNNGDHEKARDCQRRVEELYSAAASGPPDPGSPPPRPPCRLIDVKWACPIKENSFVIGFADLRATIDRPAVCLDGLGESNIEPRWQISFSKTHLFFEVKPAIRSVGELMRQINFYRTYENCPFFVVSPDDRFRSLLQSQGVGFVKVPALIS